MNIQRAFVLVLTGFSKHVKPTEMSTIGKYDMSMQNKKTIK